MRTAKVEPDLRLRRVNVECLSQHRDRVSSASGIDEGVAIVVEYLHIARAPRGERCEFVHGGLRIARPPRGLGDGLARTGQTRDRFAYLGDFAVGARVDRCARGVQPQLRVARREPDGTFERGKAACRIACLGLRNPQELENLCVGRMAVGYALGDVARAREVTALEGARCLCHRLGNVGHFGPASGWCGKPLR